MDSSICAVSSQLYLGVPPVSDPVGQHEPFPGMSGTDVVGWFDGEGAPIHDAITTGEIPVLPVDAQILNALNGILDQVDELRLQMATVMDFLEKVGPLLKLAETYTSGSKLDRTRALLGLHHG